MQKLVKEYLDELNQRQKKSRKIRIAVLLLAVIVVGSVAGVLTQYGVAMTGKEKCGLEEHVHDESCYEDVLICEKTEGEGHTHTEECGYPKELICGQEESEGHAHTEECQFPEALICGQEESEEHQHTEACYQVPEGYACGLEESGGHQHTEACYQTPEGYACGLEEGGGHTHTAECYQKNLICEKEEHTHTDICYTDAAADVEDASVWDRQYAAVEWKGIWGEDLVTAAQMQLGYQESANNYIITAEGVHKGYTRYGQFMGDPYIDWDAAFVNFCLHYAGLSASNLFPMEADTAKWCEEFRKIREENAAYLTAPGNYTPKAGDIIFFQKEGEETGSQMGIVSSYDRETVTVRVIEGNSGNEVRENAYNVGDSHIVSYLKIMELEETYKGAGGEPAEDVGQKDTEQVDGEEPEDIMEGRTMTANGSDYIVTVNFTAEAKIPKDAVLSVREISPGSEEYQEYCRQSIQAMEIEEISFARYFDVTFLVDGKEIEPSAPVDVKITYADKFEIEEDANGNAVHFSKDGTEVLDAGIDTEENSFTFTQNSFSVVGTVVAKANTSYYYKGGVPENLDGKTFLLETIRDTECIFLTGEETENAGGIKRLAGSAAEDIVSIENPEENKLWTFHRIDDTSYSIQNAALGTYLNIDGVNVTLESEACGLTVETRDDMITIRSKKYFLEADGEGHILAAAKKEEEIEGRHKFRLFGAGREYALTAEGEDYRITLNLSALDGLFDNTEFTAEEITGVEAEVYAQKAKEALGIDYPGFQRFFHLGFDKEIPDNLIHISSVTIQYKDNAEGFNINGAGGVVSFKGGDEMVVGAGETESGEADVSLPEEVEEEVLNVTMDGLENTISAEISELSDLGIMMLASTEDIYYRTYIENADELDNNEFLIANVAADSRHHSRIMGETVTDRWWVPGIQAYSFTGNNAAERSHGIGLWHFEKQANGIFYIQLAGTDSYLNINGNNVTLGSKQELSITCKEGKIIIGQGNKSYLNSYGGSNQTAFKFAGYSKADENTEMTLYAKKEVSPLTFNVKNVDEAGDLIAELEPDGTNPSIPPFVTIELEDVTSRIDLGKYCSIKKANSAEKHYEFEKVQIVYQKNGVEKIAEVDSVQFSTDGRYNMSFYLKKSLIGTYQPSEVEVQFVYHASGRNPLDIEPSIDTNNKINIKMANYDSQPFTGWLWHSNYTGVKQGILRPYLDTDGYPAFAYPAGYDTGMSDTDNNPSRGKFTSSIPGGTESLKAYFEGAQPANKLFVADKYNNGGYYEYSSLNNGAVFDKETGDFTLYKQLTTIRDYNPNTVGDEALCGKGQFLPYNTFDKNRTIANVKNTYDAHGNPLDSNSDRYGEDLYLPDEGSPDYYFGMEMSTEFYQMQNGMTGENPIRYDFTGDDDLWVYIDGVLVLDIGGCHDARKGYIDFSTGVVFVEGVTSTTLYDLFTKARDEAEKNGASQTVIDGLNEKLQDSMWKTIQKDDETTYKIFADYTKHDFKMWYMERGAGGSNLEVKFNLPLIPPGEVQIEKQLSNSEQGKYTNKAFDFQVYLQPIIGELSWAGEDNLKEDALPSEYRLLSQGLIRQGRTKAEAFLVKSDGTETKIDIPAGEGIIEAGESDNESGIFRLHPGEKLILRGLKDNRKYYVRELNLDPGEYDDVIVDQIVVDSKDNEGNGASGGGMTPVLDPDGRRHADTTTEKVSERKYVVFKNKCSDANRNALLVKKEMLSGNSNNDTYTFRIWLEDHDGSLKLYEGNYYLQNAQGKYYSREADGSLTATENADALEDINEKTPRLTTESGKPGEISGISPGDTVIIRNLLAGTGFLVEEEDPGPDYEKPRYEKAPETFEEPDPDSPAAVPGETEGETSGAKRKTEMGSIASGVNAEVIVQNEKLSNRTWHIVKMSSTEGGSPLEAVFELAPVKKEGEEDRQTYYGKSLKEKNGEIIWYEDRECTKSIPISDLRTGHYQLKEIEAFPGFSLSSEVWEVEVQARKGVSITGQEYEKKKLPPEIEGGEEITDYVYTYYNTPLYELPKAGGSGIYWYLIGGMLLMMAGALILYRNKCREVQGS